MRIHELAEAAFSEHQMQLSVAKYKAIDVDRGAAWIPWSIRSIIRRWLKDGSRTSASFVLSPTGWPR